MHAGYHDDDHDDGGSGGSVVIFVDGKHNRDFPPSPSPIINPLKPGGHKCTHRLTFILSLIAGLSSN